MTTHSCRIRSSRDVVISVAALLGYWPAASICLVLLDHLGRVDVLARWDASPAPEGDPSLPDALAPTGDAYLVVTDPTRDRPAGDWIDAMPASLAARVGLRDVIVATSREGVLEWRTASGQEAGQCSHAEARDVARAWGLSGWAPSREAYVADIDPKPELQREVASLVAAAPRVCESTRDLAILHALQWVTDARTVEPRDVATLLVAVRDIPVRDTLIWEFIHTEPSGWERIGDRLACALAGAPDGEVPAIACLLAIVRWQCGDGSRAWAALERALAACPTYPLAHLVGGCLSSGMHPATWRRGMQALTRDACRQRPATTPG